MVYPRDQWLCWDFGPLASTLFLFLAAAYQKSTWEGKCSKGTHMKVLSRMLFEGTQNSSSVLKKIMIQGIPYTWDTAIYIYLWTVPNFPCCFPTGLQVALERCHDFWEWFSLGVIVSKLTRIFPSSILSPSQRYINKQHVVQELQNILVLVCFGDYLRFTKQ